ncbi:MAG: ATP synthase subunit I [Candidatus Hydrogenedentes bacterium]|nr:ATP synthase subunit I [Candidatus Hydrogenedentota bacterium]
MEPLKRLRLMAVKISLLLSIVSAAIAFPFNSDVAQGILMGGLAGTLAFWIIAYKTEQLASKAEEGVPFSPFSLRFTLLRFGIYTATLVKAFYVDQVHMDAFIAAACGLFIIRVVLVFIAFTELDLKQEQK